MKTKCLFIILCLLIRHFQLWAEHKEPQKPMTGKAIRVHQKPKIDGKADDAIWSKKNQFYRGRFTQNRPNNGALSEQETEIYLAYDDFAIYVLAKMYDNPDSILSEFGPRDADGRNADEFGIALDTYNNQQNAFLFTVTAAGVQKDAYVTVKKDDKNWNAVWRSAIQQTEDGWIAEFEIPYLALRFPKKEIQTWGINFVRDIRRKQEKAFWNPVDVSIQGFVNQFGKLTGLENLTPPIRLSFLPYVSSYLVSNEDNEILTSINGGMDLKLGLNEAFTLDMSLIPDFGQVVADNVVLNLSPFEIQFAENRPFFTEGTELFDKGDLFYSRRVGSIFTEPDLSDNEEIIRQDNAQLLNATKISGRNRKGLGIGFFNAITDETFAIIENTETGEKRTENLDPITNFNVIVLDQNLKNNSNISLINTNVTRVEGNNANVTGIDWRFNDSRNMWNFAGFTAVTQIMELQDQGDYRNILGFKCNWAFGKQSGTHQFQVGQNIESRNYNPNDMGFLQNANKVIFFGEYRYNIFQPKGNILRLEYKFRTQHEMLQKPFIYTNFRLRQNLWIRFKNFWHINTYLNIDPSTYQDYFSPRESGWKWYFKRFPSFFQGFRFDTDKRKAFQIEAEIGYWTRPSMQQFDNWITINSRYRANNHLSFEHKLNLLWVRKERDYVTTTYLDEAETELENIIYGRRDRNEITNTLLGFYNFNELMNISLRIRHYWSNVQYNSYYDLQKNGRIVRNDFEEYDENTGEPAYNRNFNAFNVDLVYTWQFALASQMNIVWKNSIYTDETLTDYQFHDNFSRMLQSPQTNSLSIRLLYFLDYVSFKRHIGKRHKKN